MNENEAAYTVLFYLLATGAVLLALAVVNARRLLRAAIYLMGVLMASAGLYTMLGAEFLAGIQVLVYVGGIVVLIVFAIMLTRSADLMEDHPSVGRQVGGAIAAILFLAVTAGILWTAPFAMGQGQRTGEDARLIGRKLLDAGPNGYVLAFELISLLLLAAAIGGIVVARKTPPPGQPFTSGGDQPGEADAQLPLRQSDALENRGGA